MSNASAVAAATHDYLAIIYIGGGSSWGRSPDKEEAIKLAVSSLRDWSHLFKVSDVDVTINVIDVDGYNTVYWDDCGIWSGDGDKKNPERINDSRPIEKVKRRTPKWKKRH